MRRGISRRHYLGTLGAVAVTRNAAAAAGYTMRLSLAQPATTSAGQAALRFASEVRRRTNGQLIVEVYPNGQLSREQEAIDGLTTGSVDFTIENTAFLEPLFPRFLVFNLPFLFKDLSAGFRVFDGPIGTEFFTSLGEKGITGLGWGIAGFKQFETTTKAVVTPDDVRGLRVRIVGGTVYVAMYTTLGAVPVTIDASERMVALTQHTIDAMDLPLDTFLEGKFFTVCKHVAMFNHALSVLPLLASKRKVDALPAPLAQVLREEGRALVPFWRSLVVRQTAAAVKGLKDDGVAFSEIQYAAFRKAMEPVYAIVQTKIGGDLIDRMSRAAGGAG